jgi:hypothetical protein
MKDDTRMQTALDTVDASSWERLARKRIFFAHQSVGAGIVDGMSRIAAEDDKSRGTVRLKIVEGTDPALLRTPAFLHARVGTNGDPSSKMDAFSALMLGDLGDSTDIAFLKLCYQDVTAGTDVKRLFDEYETCMSRLAAARPAITFVRLTVPLTSVQTGWKAWLKALLGRPAGGAADNVKRNQLNDLLRSAYGGRAPLFDVALLEAERPDGSRATFASGGERYDLLAREYTDDGGHLNERGRRFVAGRLLVFLAEHAH